MESDENELRKPFTPSEAIAMKKLIEGKLKAEAKERQAEAGSGNLPNNKTRTSSAGTGGTSHERETRHKLAKAVGMSAGTMNRAGDPPRGRTGSPWSRPRAPPTR